MDTSAVRALSNSRYEVSPKVGTSSQATLNSVPFGGPYNHCGTLYVLVLFHWSHPSLTRASTSSRRLDRKVSYSRSAPFGEGVPFSIRCSCAGVRPSLTRSCCVLMAHSPLVGRNRE